MSERVEQLQQEIADIEKQMERVNILGGYLDAYDKSPTKENKKNVFSAFRILEVAQWKETLESGLHSQDDMSRLSKMGVQIPPVDTRVVQETLEACDRFLKNPTDETYRTSSEWWELVQVSERYHEYLSAPMARLLDAIEENNNKLSKDRIEVLVQNTIDGAIQEAIKLTKALLLLRDIQFGVVPKMLKKKERSGLAIAESFFTYLLLDPERDRYTESILIIGGILEPVASKLDLEPTTTFNGLYFRLYKEINSRRSKLNRTNA
jgi:hypothetical protein